MVRDWNYGRSKAEIVHNATKKPATTNFLRCLTSCNSCSSLPTLIRVYDSIWRTNRPTSQRWMACGNFLNFFLTFSLSRAMASYTKRISYCLFLIRWKYRCIIDCESKRKTTKWGNVYFIRYSVSMDCEVKWIEQFLPFKPPLAAGWPWWWWWCR